MSLILNQKLDMIRLTEEGMSKTEIGQMLASCTKQLANL